MIQQKHHQAELSTILDRLYLDGAVSLPWSQVYLWFNAERLGKGSYRTIRDRWNELCVEIYGHETAPDVIVLESDQSRLNLRREPFDGERLVRLEDWT